MEDLIQLKLRIQEATGIPAEIINGENIEESIASAKALIAYKNQKDKNDDPEKPNRIKFAEYMQQLQGIEQQDQAMLSLLELEKELKEGNGYPILQDAGSALVNDVRLPDGRSTQEQFASFFAELTAY